MTNRSLTGRIQLGGIVACAAAVYFSACGGSPNGPTPPSGPPAPQVFSITPAHGPAAGGTSVRIGGANFAPGATVTIGGVAATEVAVESSASITARTSPHAPGTGDVVVSVGTRSAVFSGGFTYEAGDPPVISTIAARGTRSPSEPAGFADLGETLTVTATVQDADTPADQLRFEWTADSGTFTGAGASVQWLAPAAAATPGQVTLNLAVTDGATRVTGTTRVRLHDSIKEVGDLARQFLLDFSDSNSPPDYVLRNFSQGPRCIKERDSEKADVEKNRRYYTIQSSAIGSATVNFQFGGRPCSYVPVDGDACAAVPAVWNSLCKETNVECTAGTTGRTSGTDFVTAVYEESQWRLCSSYFKSDGKAQPFFIR